MGHVIVSCLPILSAYMNDRSEGMGSVQFLAWRAREMKIRSAYKRTPSLLKTHMGLAQACDNRN